MTAAVAPLLSPALVFTRPFLRALGQGSLVADLPSLAGGIAILSGSLRDRIFYGVDRYHGGDAPLLSVRREREYAGVASLRERGANVPERRERNRDVACQRRVPRKPVEVMGRGASRTMRGIAGLLPGQRRCGIRSALLLPSKVPSRTAGAAFRPLIRAEFSARICPAPSDPFLPGGRWTRRESARPAMAEGAKLAAFELVDPWRAGLIPWTSPTPQ